MRARMLLTDTRSHSTSKAGTARLAIQRSLTLGVATLSSLPMLALAAEFESEIEAQAVRNAAISGGFQTDYVVQVMLSLLVVVGVIVLLSFLVKKFNLQPRTGSGAVRILSVVSIGAKDKLLLVEVGEEQLLLGSSPGNVQTLHKLEKPIDVYAKSENTSEDKNFLSVLSSVRRGQQS